MLATNFGYRRARLRLDQGKQDLLFGELGFLHGNLSGSHPCHNCPLFTIYLAVFTEGLHTPG
jgi:hypothetical protein